MPSKLNTTFLYFWQLVLGSTDSLSWTPTEETVLRVEKKWAGAIGIPLQRGGQLLSDGATGTGGGGG